MPYAPRAPIRRGLPVLLLLPLPLLVSCGGDGGSTDPVVVTVTISPPTASLFVGETVSLTATVSGSSASATFSSSQEAVATVNTSGVVMAVSPGQTTITASAAGASGTATITVDPSSITLSQTTVSLRPGETIQLTATVSGGSGHTVSWSSSDDAIATVDDSGLVMGVSPGSATVTASVDGQTGVEANGSVEVLDPLPTVELVSFTDTTGAAVDLGDVEGVLVANFEVEGPVGATGEIQIFIDGELFASDSFTIREDGLQGPPGGPGPLLVQRIRDAPISINTISAEQIGDAYVPSLENGLHTFTAGVQSGGEFRNVNIRGIGGSAGFQTNNNPLIIVDGVNLGPTALGSDGNTYGNGDQTDRYSLVNFGPEEIESIDVLRGPAALALYGSAAQNGVVIITTRKADHPGLQGEIRTEEVTVNLVGGATVPATIANNSPHLFSNLNLQRGQYVDWGGPYASKDFVMPGNFAIGNLWDPGTFARTYADFGPQDVTDATPVDFQWEVSRNWQFTGEVIPVTSAADVPADDSDWYWRLRGTDVFAQTSYWLAVDPLDAPVWAIRDANPPALMAVDGAMNIFPGAMLTTQGSWQAQIAGLDEPGVGQTRFSGFVPNYWSIRHTYATPLGTGFSLGSSTAYATVQEDLTQGWSLDLSHGISENWLEAVGYDFAGNYSDPLIIPFIYNYQTPSVSDVVISGDVGGFFVGGSTVQIQATLFDPLEVYAGTGGSYSPGLDLSYTPDIQTYGIPFDGSLTNSISAQFTYADYFARVQWTTGPRAGDGWYEFTHMGAGVMGTSGLTAESLQDVSGMFYAAGPLHLDLGLSSWFTDQSSLTLCVPNGGDCGATPTMGLVSARGWWAEADGLPTVTEAQLMGRKTLPNGRVLFRPLSGRVPLDVVPFPGGNEVQASVEVDAEALGLNVDYDGWSWSIFSPTGDRYMTQFRPLTVSYGVKFDLKQGDGGG